MSRPVLLAGLLLAGLAAAATVFGSVAVGSVRVVALEQRVDGTETTVALRPGPGLLVVVAVFAAWIVVSKHRQ
jgi:hypothetical protein